MIKISSSRKARSETSLLGGTYSKIIAATLPGGRTRVSSSSLLKASSRVTLSPVITTAAPQRQETTRLKEMVPVTRDFLEPSN